jgi:hypothetical protein
MMLRAKAIHLLVIAAAIGACSTHPKGTAVPANIARRGDEYIIGVVGKKYFRKNYKLISEKSKVYTPLNSKVIRCFDLCYEYRPLKVVGAVEPFVTVFLSEPTDSTGKVFGEVAVIDSTGVIVEPRVPFSSADLTFSARGADLQARTSTQVAFPGQRGVPRNGNISWFTTIEEPCPPDVTGECECVRALYVDAVNGSFWQSPIEPLCE